MIHIEPKASKKLRVGLKAGEPAFSRGGRVSPDGLSSGEVKLVVGDEGRGDKLFPYSFMGDGGDIIATRCFVLC